MDLKMLAKMKQQHDEKPQKQKSVPSGMASVEEIAKTLGMKPSAVMRRLSGRVKRAGTIRQSGGRPGFAYYDLYQVAGAFGFVEMGRATAAPEGAEASGEREQA